MFLKEWRLNKISKILGRALVQNKANLRRNAKHCNENPTKF